MTRLVLITSNTNFKELTGGRNFQILLTYYEHPQSSLTFLSNNFKPLNFNKSANIIKIFLWTSKFKKKENP